MQTSFQYKKGFTLVETLVAITILLLAITGTMTTAQKGLQSAQYANEQVTAVFLAQEAIEAVRQYRDSQALLAYHNQGGPVVVDTQQWLPPVNCAGGCTYNKNDPIPFGVCGNQRCQVLIDQNGKFVQGAFGQPTQFSRKIYYEETNPGEVNVWVEVVWDGKIFGGAERKVLLQTWLYDHYERYE
jgi:prepilin-type N-terminal cleavage/methylation domain-containing protein